MEGKMVDGLHRTPGSDGKGARRALSLAMLATLPAAVLWGPAADATNIDPPSMQVDVAVVFAVDFSSSIDPKIADLQREGHAEALTSPEIIRAISQNYIGCIGVAYFEWSSPGRSRTVLPWTRICGLDDAKAAASVISNTGDTGHMRRGRGGTSVSTAIDVGGLLLDEFPGTAMKKVIDISSNGENNDGLPVQPSRENAIAKGYTINAIAIPADDEDPRQPLASYFAQSVIGGSQAFVMSPKQPHDYVTALRRKLVTEVSMNIDTYVPPMEAQALSAPIADPR
ncbi:DUF1194 domain-containing protein [Mesorhizobium sp. M2A.F.Ca.ET.037.01.1.1]|nr:DUF1194 domain-containing protein [Mesorhizobium sp. M2A.F.Ca.ET.046.03.2.1]RUX17086.1 DUF1194 domain-containing protein [Mesorhizobium sp. M2A.F.Ca.ET.037.01.1.1]RUY00835.1 DUF1194 domain-containing protein [Mesorhizobium sp. M2A.F.Ca.ET.040.01.1.1]RVC68429.1 DUF1194 domain-containing protein [Mesorhizobium sp. M00.F.Ca.ET.038.03.1.1]RWA87783.1 MAG: DUF1194 domain-containing protein [Mesorhizobium sp.]RWX69615.1 DUF1194 domain-containing protein [Mesorhizobium sp. M2A.F.Ca.ET.039.01.1.1]